MQILLPIRVVILTKRRYGLNTPMGTLEAAQEAPLQDECTEGTYGSITVQTAIGNSGIKRGPERLRSGLRLQAGYKGRRRTAASMRAV
jgi:hypothetical protein